jgi:hypothetical protein
MKIACRIVLNIALGACVFMIGCPIPGFIGGRHGTAGDIILTVKPFGQARAIRPMQADIEIHSYGVQGTGPDGAVISPLHFSASPITVPNLTPGKWDLQVTAGNAAGADIASGSATLSVISGRTESAAIELLPIVGKGTLRLNLSFGGLVVSVSGATLKKGSDAPIEAPFVAGTNGDFSASAELASGFYLLSFDMHSGEKNVSVVETAQIFADLVSEKTMRFSEADFIAPPAAPTGLAATPDGTLSWTDSSETETGYSVERRTDSGQWIVLSDPLPPNTTIYIDATLGSASRYDYRVRAKNTNGYSAYSDIATLLLNTGEMKPENVPFSPDADTIALYHFDGDSSDSSGNSLDLMPNGDVSFAGDGPAWMSSPSGSVARFHTIGDSLDLDVPDDLIMPNGRISSLTIEARIVIRRCIAYEAQKGEAFIVSLHQSYDSFIDLSQGNWDSDPGEPHLWARSADNTDYSYPITKEQWAASVSWYAWHAVRITLADDLPEGDTGVGTLSIYVDGELLGSSSVFMNTNNPAPWHLSVGNLDGDIDELRISRGVRPYPNQGHPTIELHTAYQELTLPSLSLVLDPTVTSPGQFAVRWTRIKGPTGVSFDDASRARTTARFPGAGKYVIQLEARDGESAITDCMVVQVWPVGGRDRPYRVLYSGHSLVYYGAMPHVVQAIARSAGGVDSETVVDMHTSPDRHVKDFWYFHQYGETDAPTNYTDFPKPGIPNDGPGYFLSEVIINNDWDFIVLCEYVSEWDGVLPENRAQVIASDKLYIEKFDGLIKQVGARTVIAAVPLSRLDTATSLSDKLHALVIPHIVVWDAAINAGWDTPGPNRNGLYSPTDYPHPTADGVYLYAVATCASIFGKDPRGLYAPCEISPGFADYSQDLAWTTVQSDPRYISR